MAEPSARWIDAPEFQWNPELPFCAEPQSSEPRFAEPQFAGAPFAASPANDDAISERQAAAPLRKAPAYLRSRLVIGGAQGLGLFFLLAASGTLISPPGLVLLFAPLLLLAGLGHVPGKLLLPWTVTAGFGLALLGAHQASGGANLLLIAVVAPFLFISQAMIAAWGKSGTSLAGYAAWHDSAWTLALQCLFCILAALGTLMLIQYGFGLLRPAYPDARPAFVIALFVPPAVALASWLASPRRAARLQEFIVAALTLLLPPVVLLAAATDVAGLLLQWQPPLLVCLVEAFFLLLCINASYGKGESRPRWREILEAAGSFALGPLVLLGAAALGPAVALGWSGPRRLAAALLAMLAGYAVLYAASALIGLGGGGWMKRIERANPALALVALVLLAGLAVSV